MDTKTEKLAMMDKGRPDRASLIWEHVRAGLSNPPSGQNLFLCPTSLVKNYW